MTFQPKLSEIIPTFSLNFFQANFNNAIETSTFPEQLKNVDVKPVFKKAFRTDKENYRPISTLPNVSKIYEKSPNKQLEQYLQALLDKYQCGLRKVCSVISALLPMIEKWRKSLDGGNFILMGTICLF